MKLIKELPLQRQTKDFRHTLVQGRDGKFYTVTSWALYDRQVADWHENFEVMVNETKEDGTWDVTNGVYMKRFKTKDDAVEHHTWLLARFDETLKLPPAKAPAAHAPAPAAGH